MYFLITTVVANVRSFRWDFIRRIVIDVRHVVYYRGTTKAGVPSIDVHLNVRFSRQSASIFLQHLQREDTICHIDIEINVLILGTHCLSNVK